MNCPYCGAQLPDTAKMCFNCSNSLYPVNNTPAFSFQQQPNYSANTYQQAYQQTYQQPYYQQPYNQSQNAQTQAPPNNSETVRFRIGILGLIFITIFSLAGLILLLTGNVSVSLACFVLVICVIIAAYLEYVRKKIAANPDAYITQQSLATPSSNNNKITCRRCGSTNVTISINTYQMNTKGRSQVKKKSTARRAATGAARATANLMTMGTYCFFSKKPSKYIEVQKEKTRMVQEKIAICQGCGNSWRVF